ncbi:MAG: response regulator [Gammaproteobacteria bacterium]|nr:response regulator [Gammaproteobacteria bacterium]
MTRAPHQILIIEDEPGIREALRVLLVREGYRAIEAPNAARAQIETRNHKPDLLIVDLGLPDGDGLDLIRRIRTWSSLPIVVLSARTLEEQKIAALDAGADDFVTKPFSAPELLARVRAGLRRGARATAGDAPLAFGAVRVDLAGRRTHGAHGEIHLTPVEYRVLESLARRGGMVVPQRMLLREVWGPDRAQDTRGLRVFINSLRAKIEPDPRRPRYLVTETGIGYRLCPDEVGEDTGAGSDRER